VDEIDLSYLESKLLFKEEGNRYEESIMIVGPMLCVSVGLHHSTSRGWVDAEIQIHTSEGFIKLGAGSGIIKKNFFYGVDAPMVLQERICY
jgi:hypothetical protein